MDKTEELRQALRDFAGQVGPECTLLGQVRSVDEDALTCVLYDEESDLDFPDVRLRPVIDRVESLTIFPKVSAWALAVRLEDSEDWMLLSAGEYDKYRLKIGETLFEMDAEGLLIQKGETTLLSCLEMIIEAIMQIVVIQGNNPDYPKLTQALTKLKTILR